MCHREEATTVVEIAKVDTRIIQSGQIWYTETVISDSVYRDSQVKVGIQRQSGQIQLTETVRSKLVYRDTQVKFGIYKETPRQPGPICYTETVRLNSVDRDSQINSVYKDIQVRVGVQRHSGQILYSGKVRS